MSVGDVIAVDRIPAPKQILVDIKFMLRLTKIYGANDPGQALSPLPYNPFLSVKDVEGMYSLQGPANV